MNLCKYKDELGEPGKGIHSYRIFNIAIADMVMTIIGAYAISYFFKYSFLWTFIWFFLLGVALHRIFCVKTTMTLFLFPNMK